MAGCRSSLGETHHHVRLRADRVLNLALALWRDAYSGDQNLTVGSRYLDRVAQIGANPVQRSPDAQLVADSCHGRGRGSYVRRNTRRQIRMIFEGVTFR